MHESTVFKVRPWGENVKWPGLGHQIFSFPSLSANHLPEIFKCMCVCVRVCAFVCICVHAATYTGLADQTIEPSWLY